MLYITGVFATVIISDTGKVDIITSEELFSSVPRSMFTSFRCYTGDCTTSDGSSIAKLLADAYGPAFILAYVASVMVISFGLFNLIMAFYVDITTSAARSNQAQSRQQQNRNSVRIAFIIKDLIYKFWAASQLVSKQQGQNLGNSAFDTALKSMLTRRGSKCSSAFDHSVSIAEVSITRELFQLIIQNPGVQQDLDELEIEPDRAHLFDILDSTGSGRLQAEELITGLLKIRGSSRRSDQVACLIKVEGLHETLRKVLVNLDDVCQRITPYQSQSVSSKEQTC